MVKKTVAAGTAVTEVKSPVVKKDNGFWTPDRKKKVMKIKNRLRMQAPYYVMLLLPLIFYAVFCYGPMYGVTIAFKDYNIFKGINESPWVGFEIFKSIFSVPTFLKSVVATLRLNFLDLLIGFPAPIFLAVVINELRNQKFKKVTQTVIYLPHFLSMVVVAGMVQRLFATNSGMVNNLLRSLGLNEIPFLSEFWHWTFTYVFSGVWQAAGWGTIIYLATISGIDQQLYEAATVDGAGRLQQIWHITLPGIRSTAVMLLIMNVGKIMGGGFERPYLLGNPMVSDASNVLSVYTYELGLVSGSYSMATAVGLFQSLVGIILLLIVNAIAKKLGEEGIV